MEPKSSRRQISELNEASCVNPAVLSMQQHDRHDHHLTPNQLLQCLAFISRNLKKKFWLILDWIFCFEEIQ